MRNAPVNRYIGQDIFGGQAHLTEQSLAAEWEWLVRAFSGFSSALVGLMLGLLLAGDISLAEQTVVGIACAAFSLWLGTRYYRFCCVIAGSALIGLICLDFAVGLFS